MRVANAFSKWHQLNQIVKFSGISNLEGLCSLFNYLIEKLEFPYKYLYYEITILKALTHHRNKE